MLKGKLAVMLYRITCLFFCLDNKVAFDERVNCLKKDRGSEIGCQFKEG